MIPIKPIAHLLAKSARSFTNVRFLQTVAVSVEKPSPLRPLYLDTQATSAIDPRVLDSMLPYMTNMYGNPHSRTHQFGWESEVAVETARAQVAKLVGAEPKEIIFTSGATEANNTAIKGVGRFHKDHKKHVITTTTEHKCKDPFLLQ